jgi:Bacterial SH3 domain
MKKVFSLQFYLMFFIFSEVASQDVYVVTSPDGFANLRQDKSVTKKPLQKVLKGELVEVLEKDDRMVNRHVWYKVKSQNGKKGFMASELLTKKERAEPEVLPRIGSKNPNRRPVAPNLTYDIGESKAFWDDGKALTKQLCQELDGIWGKDFQSNKIASLFRSYSEKINDLNRENVYEEIVEDVNAKTAYLDFVANEISGAELKYGKNAAEVLGREIIKKADFTKKIKPWIPLPDLALIDPKVFQEMKNKLNKVNESENETIKLVRKKYGLILNRW